MFDKSVYVNRRKQLIDKMSGGLVLILGNEEAPANYPSNTCLLYTSDAADE